MHESLITRCGSYSVNPGFSAPQPMPQQRSSQLRPKPVIIDPRTTACRLRNSQHIPLLSGDDLLDWEVANANRSPSSWTRATVGSGRAATAVRYEKVEALTSPFAVDTNPNFIDDALKRIGLQSLCGKKRFRSCSLFLQFYLFFLATQFSFLPTRLNT